MAITNNTITTSSKKTANNSAKKSSTAKSAATMPVPDPYTCEMRLRVVDGVALIQPATGRGSTVDVDTLVIDLPTGRVTREPRPALGDDAAQILAVVGLLRMRSGAALAVVTGAQQVAALDGEPVYRVERTAVIPAGVRVVAGPSEDQPLAIITTITAPSSSSPASDGGAPVGDADLIKLLRDALNPSGAGRSLFFSHGTHLTLNTQRREDLAAAVAAGQAAPASVARSADRRFFWNRALAQPLLDAQADPFVPTMIMGSVHVIDNVTLPAVDGAETGASPIPPSMREPGAGSSITVGVQLIARRAVDRIGTRYWRRGADPDSASVANFVETEQVVTARWATSPGASPPDARQSNYLASLVQVRGNMPMVWTQIPDGDFKPPFVLLDGAGTRRAFDEHVKSLRDIYSYPAAEFATTTLVNLVKQEGDEGALAAEYGAQAARYNSEHKAAASAAPAPLHYVPFDFHHECSTDDAYAAGLAKLWALIEDDFNASGMWTRLTSPVTGARSRQVGVIRTNCIDCLDRTNVGQSLVGRKALARALASVGAISGEAAADISGAGPVLPPALEKAYKNMWADHGDDISRQYAGTGALKSDVTRKGERTRWGTIQDAFKSADRYLINTFFDGHKQDALTLATGAYVPLKGAAPARSCGPARGSPAQQQVLLTAVVALATMAWAGGGAGSFSPSSSSSSAVAFVAALSQQLASLDDFWKTLLVVLAVVAALALLLLLLAPYLVDAPRLCPEMADTVSVCVARGDGVARDLSDVKTSGAGGAGVVAAAREAAAAGKARRAKAE